MFSGMRSTDVVTPAQYLVQASNDLLRAARDNDADVTRMIVTKDKANALVNNQKLRDAVAKQATETEIKFKDKLKRVNDRISGEIDEIVAPIPRMAGVLSLLGGGAMAGVMNQNRIIDKEEQIAAKTERQNQLTKIQELFQPTESTTSFDSEIQSADEAIKSADQALSDFISSRNVNNTSTSADVLKAQPSKITGKLVSQSDVYKGLLQRGLSEADARTGSAVMKAESGGDSGISTDMTIDPNKSNEWSIGLMQINYQAHADKLSRRGLGPEALRDPNINLDVAVEVFKEAGNKWTPWSAFKNNKHIPFMSGI